MRRRIVVAGLVLCVFPTAAEAQLGPTKPSDLADLTSSLASCTLNIPRNNTQAVDRINRPDGSTAPFVIPPQHVFIVTSVELGGLLVPAGKRFDLVLFRSSTEKSEGRSWTRLADRLAVRSTLT